MDQTKAPLDGTALIIDDDPAERTLFSFVLEEQGLHVTTAEHGEEGLRLAARLRPDLIMLDIVMPDVDGFEVCRRLHAHATLSEMYGSW